MNCLFQVHVSPAVLMYTMLEGTVLITMALLGHALHIVKKEGCAHTIVTLLGTSSMVFIVGALFYDMQHMVMIISEQCMLNVCYFIFRALLVRQPWLDYWQPEARLAPN